MMAWPRPIEDNQANALSAFPSRRSARSNAPTTAARSRDRRRLMAARAARSRGPIVARAGHAQSARYSRGSARRLPASAFCDHLARPLHRGGPPPQAARWQGESRRATSRVTVATGPGAGSYLPRRRSISLLVGGVLGQRVAPLGVEKFGRRKPSTLYAATADADAITEGVAELRCS